METTKMKPSLNQPRKFATHNVILLHTGINRRNDLSTDPSNTEDESTARDTEDESTAKNANFYVSRFLNRQGGSVICART